jgi:3-hydroxybutyryl-CoA dehydrogenase
MEIKHIFVVGAGTMGNGIAQTAAVSGFQVTMMDVVPEQIERAKVSIAKSVEKLASKGVIDENQIRAALAIATTSGLDQVPEADLVIEAASENPELKLDIFEQLDQLARPEVILASNTSSISLTKIGAATKRAHKVVGMHFFNPVPLMRLVEIIRGLATSDETTQTAIDIAKRWARNR